MLAARRRTSTAPPRRRCCPCQQKHIKCEYEKNDDKCKACRANDRKCVVKHRFQHVNPAFKRQRKRASSDQPKGSEKSTQETIPGATSEFSVIEWTSQDQTTAANFSQVDTVDDDDEMDDDMDENGPEQNEAEEEALSQGRQAEPTITEEDGQSQEQIITQQAQSLPFPPPPPPPPRSQPAAIPAANTTPDQNLFRHGSAQSKSPSLPFSTPNFDQFSHSPNLSAPVFSPGAFSSTALQQHTSPVSVPGSIPTPEGSRLAEKEKAFLLRHFTDVLWKWFDVCDPEQHFRRVVPIRALKCPTLMKAICASSAWHLCRKGQYDRERSDFLYENCLRHLIKAMDSPNIGADDSILIAATIMHNVEELRDLEHTLMLESRGHLVGINIFLDAAGSYWEQNSLRQAALRVAMREELHTCFINQQPLTLPPNLVGVDRGFGPADDETWAWRVLLIYRDGLANSLSPSTIAEWDRIYSELQSWYNLKPDSFEPTFFQEPNPGEGRFLPETWFLHDSHIVGMIHYHLCRIVLATSNPRVPRIGWNRAAALKKVDEEVRQNLIEVAGIAVSNCLLPSAMTAGTMAVTMCAEVVTDPSLQTALFEVFLKAREAHGWPIEASQAYVRSLWYGEGEIERTIGFGLGLGS